MSNSPLIQSVSGYFTPDGFRHAFVATTAGNLHEIFFKPNKGIDELLLYQSRLRSNVKEIDKEVNILRKNRERIEKAHPQRSTLISLMFVLDNGSISV